MSRLSRLRGRTPLRVQLVAGTLVLVGVALLITGVTAIAALRGYLLDRLDNQLRATAGQTVGRVERGFLPRGPDQQSGPQQGPRGDRIEGPGGYAVQIRSASGALVAEQLSGTEARSAPDLPPLTVAQVSARHGAPFTVDARQGPGQWRAVGVPLSDGSGSVLISLSQADADSTLGRLAGIEAVVGAIVLVLLGLLGYGLVRTSLRPLVEMERTAEAIAGGDLTQRVPDAHPGTEVGRLARALNGMLAQIEVAFGAQAASEAGARQSEERMRRFVADASHELRTPLTSIRGFAELYRQGAANGPSDVARAMRRIESEGERMGVLVDDLLLLARLDQHRPLERRPVDLVEVAADAVSDANAVAPERIVELSVLQDGDAPVVPGDEARLRQVLGNLTSNALTHTPPGTPVRISVGTTDLDGSRWGVVEVHDDGPGVAPEDADRVFERFYRGDASRTRASGGSGLGLSIVAAIVAAHNGRVELVAPNGAGATFRVLLPLAPGDGTGGPAPDQAAQPDLQDAPV
ncbi:MAG: HAMP domain-containing histidine kinase [Actinomycetota bacterium]|nr:HAMP domain-containing histidine kinase [Actinomycetota bacterium]